MNTFRKLVLLTGALFLFVNIINAQNLKEYDWEPAKYMQLDQRYKDANQAYILRKNKSEYEFDDDTKRVSVTIMNHFIIQVNTEKGLKMRPEIVPMKDSEKREVLTFKIRIIHPDGTVEEFSKEDLKERKESERPIIPGEFEDEDEEDDEEEDDEEDETYEYFDLGGLKIGSQLEFFQVYKIENVGLSGNMIAYQSTIPVQDYSFEIKINKEFTMEFKSYNGAPEFVKDSTNKVRSVYTMEDRMIDGFKNEKVTNFQGNARKFIYKLDGYELGKTKNFYNNDDFARNLYAYFYDLDKSQTKSVKKFLKASKAKSAASDVDKIKTLENYLKENYLIVNFLGGFSGVIDFTKLLETKMISGEYACKLMINSLQMLDIKHELVVTSNRYDYRYDKDFESNYYMDRFLIYFPDTKEYLDPNSGSLRYGFVPEAFTHNYGLFIKSVTAGGVSSGAGKVKFIEALNRDKSVDDYEMNVSFNETLNSIYVDMVRSMTGYFSSDWQANYRKLDPEQRVRYQKALVSFIDEDLDVSKMEFENTEKADILVKPFIVKSNAMSTKLVEQKGDSLLLNVGKLTGDQMRLDDENRMLPIERPSAKTYLRTLNIELPEGYTIENIEELNKDFTVTNEKGAVAGRFKSTYTLNGNKLVITIEEWYEDIILPVSKYQEFRAVMNASDDFSKLVLVLVK